ncbi:inhibitor of growth protein [Musa troglodytarum]|uniref:PHD finger protein ING n=1 Tax=Musa troglodytarum TaxID=320322 RepID=A0A9E7K805_9LILI|nr:inhibitor of growth protein [Musa troglodytarum]
MAIARTGVFVDDYLEYSSTLAVELQRLLSTMRELDERAHDHKYSKSLHCISMLKKHSDDIMMSTEESRPDIEAEFEKMKKEIEASQENALSLCTEKVLLAQQAYDLIESHLKRLDEDLNQFMEDLKQEGKIPPHEPAILPPVPIVYKDEKRKGGYTTPQPRKFRERDWGREQDMDIEFMPPPSSHKKNIPASVDVDQPIDPNEPTYCVCHQVSFGDMIACDNENCEGGEWFHYSCVGLTPETRFKGKWFCPTCRNQQ